MTRKTPLGLKTVSILSLSLVAACKGAPPRFDGKFWAADSARQSIRRAQDNEEIKCEAPKFDDYVCLTYADLQRWYDTYVLGCKKWSAESQKMTTEEVTDLAHQIYGLEMIGRLRGESVHSGADETGSAP